jgi:ABC-2 type transport system permease protein
MRAALAITRASVRRVTRDRTALFFVLVLPVAVILIVGVSVRGFSTFRVGVVDLGAGASGERVVAALSHEATLSVSRYPDLTAVDKAVGRSELNTAVVLPAGMDAALRAGRAVTVAVVARQSDATQEAAAQAVEAVLSRQGALVQAAQFTVSQVSASYDSALRVAQSTASHVGQARVATQQVDSNADVLPQGFSYSAPTMLVMFIFISGLAGGSNVVDARRLGIYERVGSAPVRPSSVILGESLAYGTITLTQALLIVIVGAVVFGVSWGNPLAAAVLVLTWALVGAGAGMLSGTVWRTPEQAGAMGPVVGIAFAMLGGCMWPLSIVSATMRQVGHATPHAWAVDAFTALLARHGTIVTIAPQLLVLAAFAVGLLGLAALRFRRVLAVR